MKPPFVLVTQGGMHLTRDDLHWNWNCKVPSRSRTRGEIATMFPTIMFPLVLFLIAEQTAFNNETSNHRADHPLSVLRCTPKCTTLRGSPGACSDPWEVCNAPVSNSVLPSPSYSQPMSVPYTGPHNYYAPTSLAYSTASSDSVNSPPTPPSGIIHMPLVPQTRPWLTEPTPWSPQHVLPAYKDFSTMQLEDWEVWLEEPKLPVQEPFQDITKLSPWGC